VAERIYTLKDIINDLRKFESFDKERQRKKAIDAGKGDSFHYESRLDRAKSINVNNLLEYSNYQDSKNQKSTKPTPKPSQIKYLFCSNIRGESDNYNVGMLFFDSIDLNSKIKIYCSCQDFFWLFKPNLDDSLLKNDDISDIKQINKNVCSFPFVSDGKTKNERDPRNPNNYKGMCKHLIALVNNGINKKYPRVTINY
jgi:hypothetical protein